MAWACRRDGACCTEPDEVVLTREERDVLVDAAPSGVVLTFLPHADARFVRLRAKPCPLYDHTTKGCTVYDVRPYNCRRFACLRDDYPAQRFDYLDATPLTRPQFRQLRVIQQRAQRWGAAHGWQA